MEANRNARMLEMKSQTISEDDARDQARSQTVACFGKEWS